MTREEQDAIRAEIESIVRALEILDRSAFSRKPGEHVHEKRLIRKTILRLQVLSARIM
jgi:hypothetical protein